MRPLKSERAAITGVRWAMRLCCPQRPPKAQILALPLNKHACSSLERERIPKYLSFKGIKGETLSSVCTRNTKGTKKMYLTQFVDRSLGEQSFAPMVFSSFFLCSVCCWTQMKGCMTWTSPGVYRWFKVCGCDFIGQTGWAQWRWTRRSALRTSRRGCVWYWKTR